MSFFSQYSQSLEWDKCALCEAIVAGDRADPADGVDIRLRMRYTVTCRLRVCIAQTFMAWIVSVFLV